MERGSDWWLGDDRRWRRGSPPPGWEQDADGRWRPPAAPDADDTEPIQRVNADTPALHRVRSRAGHEPRTPRGIRGRFAALPEGARLGAAAVAAGVVLGAAMLLTVRAADDPPATDPADGPGGSRPGAATTDTVRPGGGPGDATPTPTPTPTPGDERSTTTSTGPASTTTSTTAPGADPLALCTPGQRAIVERGNRPWSWYVERFDPDGNGIFCE